MVSFMNSQWYGETFWREKKATEVVMDLLDWLSLLKHSFYRNRCEKFCGNLSQSHQQVFRHIFLCSKNSEFISRINFKVSFYGNTFSKKKIYFWSYQIIFQAHNIIFREKKSNKTVTIALKERFFDFTSQLAYFRWKFTNIFSAFVLLLFYLQILPPEAWLHSFYYLEWNKKYK